LQGIVAADTASMLTPYLRKADTTLLNLTSRFAAKLNISDTASMLSNYNSRINLKLNISDTASMLSNYLRSGVAASTYQTKLSGTGFVKASGTTISYDNSNYLRTGLADSSYLKLTGGTLTGGLTGTTGSFNTKLTAGNIGGSSGSPVFTAGLSGTETEFHIYQGTGYEGSPTTLRLTNNNGGYYQNGLFLKSIMERGLDEYNGRIGIMGTDFMILTKNNRIGIFNPSPSTTLDITGTLNATGATTLGSTLAVTGNITEGGNNVLTNLDTASLSSRIDSKYNSSGGTISGAVTLSTTTATPSTLLGKDGSNVVGTVTTVAQTGLFGRGLVTNEVTNANGIITVPHGFSFTPIMAFANLPGSTTNIVNVKEVDGTNIVFVVRDGATNNVLNGITVSKIEFFAIK
jgi:hypothetical protein